MTNEIERLARGAQLSVVWRKEPVVFDAALREVIRQEAEGLCLSALEMVSGAGHDAAHVAAKAPTAMIFIPRARACHITNANIPRRSNVPTARTCCCEACFAPTNCFMVDLNDGFHSAPPDTTPASAPLRPPNAPVATGPTAIFGGSRRGLRQTASAQPYRGRWAIRRADFSHAGSAKSGCAGPNTLWDFVRDRDQSMSAWAIKIRSAALRFLG
ncbi:M20/M25/M40 family metallo-hydrolase [Sinorhizobium meliloti]|uniref:M20/M25/M40 family metallo-hydrolase n=1 Tax=Rhizobium meliloti TaxID=382 RepID=UPI001F491CCC|nr:M20/M25/M40 family metallo-hydrolase [Sinorhizobium meliloti]